MNVHSRWKKWRSELPLLENIKIERCVKPPGFGVPVTVEIHSFSDASDVGLSQVSYLRLVNSSGQVHVSFLMGKARVAPLKPMSTPRCELTAAVISVNVTSMLNKERDYKNIEEIYYTDSSVVLGYISNDARRFHIYVGNRVQHIRDRSKPSQWHYVASEDKPADVASRGLTAKELLEHHHWFKGPDRLWEGHTAVVNSDLNTDLNPEDVEVKKVMATVCLSNSKAPSNMAKETLPDPLDMKCFSHSSSLHRLKRSIVRIQRMIENKRTNKQYNVRPIDGPLTVAELRLAEAVILKSVQFQYFHAELQIL